MARRTGTDTVAVVIAAVIGAAIIGLTVYGVTWLDSYHCAKSWQDSGMKSRHAFITGCQVQRADGTWVPQETIRNTGD